MLTGILAFFIDAIIGDPETKWHPVALIGRFIAFLEKILYSINDNDNKKLIMGGILVVITLAVSYSLATGIMLLAYKAEYNYISTFIAALMLSFCISPKSLAKAGRGIYALLLVNDIDLARKKVGYIVGRDTDKLNEGEITRATVETIAENTVDGIIAPLFFFAIGGVPLAVLYRSANTLDSMVGYKNEKYLYFGRAAARLDDVLNYIPARITGILLIFSAWILGYDYKFAYQMMLRDAVKHPSPNGGYAEATVAGALHIRLGGYNSYFGKTSFRAYMGEPLEKLRAKHILGSIRLMYTATILFIIILYAMWGL